MKMLRTIGLMSGTSLDGVDAAWLETDGTRIGRLGPALTLPYDDLLRSDLRRLLDLAPTLNPTDPFLADVTTRLTQRHIDAVAAIGEPADIIGFHGQTILHQPEHRRTWQIGNPHTLARATNTPVAYDFRTADVAAGGQGAPLVPVYHQALAEPLEKPLAILNIGGVANVTWIGAHGGLLAFDTGPGNGPLDDWAAQHSNLSIDADGRLSAQGHVNETVLANLMAHDYFTRPAPKSLDRLDFSRALAASGIDTLSPPDGAATLVAFTAASVAAGVLPRLVKRWLITGGGRLNPTIMTALANRLSVPVQPVEAVGWNGDALEAQCFGFLAARVLTNLPLSFPGTTGAPRAMPGGQIIRPQRTPYG